MDTTQQTFQSRKRSNSQEGDIVIKNLMLNLDESKDKQLSEEKQEKISTENESSEKFSKMAVLDNMNLKPEGVSYGRVKGFKIRDNTEDEQRKSIKLTEDIMFQGLSSEDLLRQYQSAQKFKYSFEIIKYLTDDSLQYMDALKL